MLVSIIVPYFNDPEYINQSINSALNQTYKKIEIIIIDDENSKNSKETLNKIKKKSKKIKIYNTKKNRGVAFARNLGIYKSKGKFVAFLDSDDLWENNKLFEQISMFKKKNIDICFTGYSGIKDNKQIIYKVRPPQFINFENLLKECPISCSTILLKKKVLRDTKFKNLKTKEDYLLWLELAKKNFKFFGVNKYLTLYRVRKYSLSSLHLNKLLSAFKIYSYYLNYDYLRTLLFVIRLYINAFRKKYL
tara:strand:- start:288 stop:1031 length:744 start_codon:yes stop_codon:yes gene_type:complete